MAFTLFDAHIAAHEKVGTVLFGQTTASTGTTSVEDQTQSSAHADDQFNGGSIYFIRSGDQNSTSLFIEKQSRRILDYDASSGQYIFSALATSGGSSGLIANDSLFGVATPEFNLQLMDRLVNATLRTLGPMPFTDRSLRSSVNQHVYTLSTNIKYTEILSVDFAGNVVSTTDDPDWQSIRSYDVQPSSAGAGDLLILRDELPNDRDIRIIYMGHHPTLTASTQIIDERLHPELVTLGVVEKMYEFRNSRARGAQEFDVQRWNDAKRQFAEARVRWPMWKPRRKAKLFIPGKTARIRSPSPPPWGNFD